MGATNESVFARYEMTATGRAADLRSNSPILAERMTAAERENAELVTGFGLGAALKSDPAESEGDSIDRRRRRAIFNAIGGYRADHDGDWPTEAKQRQSYVKDPGVLKGVTLGDHGFSYREKP